MLVTHSNSVEGPQPMEVLVGRVGDPPAMKFTWRIQNFSTLNNKKLYSDMFIVDGCEWRVVIFPKGNNVDYLSLYLGAADSETLPYGWSRNVQFNLAVVDQISNKCSVTKGTQHQFNATESDWGWTSFMSLHELYDPSRGYLVNDTVMIEAEVRLKKEQEAEGLCIIIKVARDEDLAEQIGKDTYFDLVDHDKVHSFRIKKQTPFGLFKEEVSKEFGIPVQFQRFWIWAKRQNYTYRPQRPLTPQEELQSVGQLREANKTHNHNAELKLFLEVEFGPDLRPLPPPDKTKKDILLFLKLYEPEKLELRFVGRLFVKSSSKPIKILAKLNQLAGFSPEEEIELYEEIKFEPCIMFEHLDKRISFRLSQIEDGDIICFQKSTPVESEEECKYPDVPSFLDYVHNRQIVHFRSLEKPKEEDFSLELSKQHTYDDVVEKVANQIGLEEPTKIRLTAHNCYSQQPKPQPIKYRGLEHLTDMLVHYSQSSDILYYEVLDKPLPELERLKNHATNDFAIDQCSFKNFTNYILEEEKKLGLNDSLLYVLHFTKDIERVQNLGKPFFLVIHEGETLADVKVRIQKKLQVPDEEFSKWKFACWSFGRPDYLQDSDIVSSRLQRRDVYGARRQCLWLEHCFDAPKRAYAANKATVVPEAQAEPTPPEETTQETLESMTSNVGNETSNKEIETQTDAPKVTMGSLASPSSSNDDLTLRRLSAAEELLKSPSVSDLISPKLCTSAEALAALKTLSLYANSSLTSLCIDRAYEEFTVALKLLTEQGIIPLRISSMLKDLLQSLECEIPKYVSAEKELSQGKELLAQHEEIKGRMELAMQKCEKTKDIVANYGAKVAELKAELARIREKRAKTMVDQRTVVDEMESLNQSLADSSSKCESFTVRQAMLTVEKDASLGTWIVVKDVLKDHFKF